MDMNDLEIKWRTWAVGEVQKRSVNFSLPGSPQKKVDSDFMQQNSQDRLQLLIERSELFHPIYHRTTLLCRIHQLFPALF
jgi:hypothetical protein